MTKAKVTTVGESVLEVEGELGPSPMEPDFKQPEEQPVKVEARRFSEAEIASRYQEFLKRSGGK